MANTKEQTLFILIVIRTTMYKKQSNLASIKKPKLKWAVDTPPETLGQLLSNTEAIISTVELCPTVKAKKRG